MDFSKAIDKVLHDRLLWDVGSHGIQEELANWTHNHTIDCDESQHLNVYRFSFNVKNHRSVPESPPEILITHEKLIVEKPSTLYCHAWGFYPQKISIQWLHIHNAQASESDVKITTRLSPFRNFDGTFNATSQMNFTPTLQDHKTIRTCQVLHTTSKEWIIKNITLNVKYGPQPVIYYRNSILDHFEPLLENIIYIEPQSYLELRCTTDSNPASNVIWMKSGGHTERIQLANGVGNSVLLNKKTDDSYNGMYICSADNEVGSKELPLAIHVIAAWKSYFTHRFVTVPIFVMTVVLLLLWTNKDRCFLCNRRNTKQLKNQHQWIKDNTYEDVGNQEDKIMTSEF
ncbi:synaptogenesis protein syg-2-like [Hemitrygon akajei]|uniref:synaptogenesis protein syg-2-like n=1 Tax=Hemitrygon akajei TaxID=2704970 RepID=UPI003BF9C5F7